MAIFTAIELCGSFLTGKTGPGETKKNFLAFCKSKYMPFKYKEISGLLYSIFRNGVAHSYIPKGSALISGRKKDEIYHLCFFDKGLFVYIPKLAEDLKVAIESFVKDLKKDNKLQNNYYKVLIELDKTGKKVYSDYVKDHKIKLKKISVKRDIIVKI